MFSHIPTSMGDEVPMAKRRQLAADLRNVRTKGELENFLVDLLDEFPEEVKVQVDQARAQLDREIKEYETEEDVAVGMVVNSLFEELFSRGRMLSTMPGGKRRGKSRKTRRRGRRGTTRRRS